MSWCGPVRCRLNLWACFLGRDFLEAIGGVTSFTRRVLRADHLEGKRIPLRQITAGHFYLNVFPEKWKAMA